MGAEVAVASVVVGGKYYEHRQKKKAAKKERKAVRREEEAREIGAAREEHERQMSLRQQMRQERIRKAQIVAAAEAAGVSGSSAEISAIGTGQTLAAAGTAFATGQTEAAEEQSLLLQQGANFRGKAAADRARAGYGSTAFNLGVSAFQTGLVEF